MLDDDSIRGELEESRKILKSKLGDARRLVAYPNGDYDARVIRAVKRAGFLGGFTCKPGVNETIERPFEVKRTNMREDSGIGPWGTFSPLFYRIELSGVKHSMKRALKRSTRASRREIE
jgi:peptidoglycan/xylan/chitin deacetylase (PgdA/CDA1 family)